MSASQRLNYINFLKNGMPLKKKKTEFISEVKLFNLEIQKQKREKRERNISHS